MRMWMASVVLVVMTSCLSMLPAQQKLDIRAGEYFTAGRFHEAAAHVEARMKSARISVVELWVLCGSYYQLRRYRELFVQLELLEQRIQGGESQGMDYDGDPKDLFGVPQLIRAKAYLDLGQYDKSITDANTALQQIRGRRTDELKIEAHGTRGLAAALTGDRTTAVADVDAIGRIGAAHLEPTKFTSIARIHMALRDYAAAYRAITDPRIGTGAAASGRRRFAARVTGIQLGGTFQDLPRTFIEAKCLYELGRFKEAEPRYRELLRHPFIEQFGGIYWIILFDLGLVTERAGDATGAIDLLARSTDVIERQRSSIDTEIGRIGFVGDKQAVYAALVRLLAASKRAADAFEVVERAKGRALVDLLASRGKAKIELGASESNRALVRELDVIDQTSAALVPVGTSQRGLVRTRVSEIARTEPQLASLVAVQRVTAASIQQRLRADETLVEYYASESTLYTFVVTRSRVAVTEAPVADLAKTVAAFRAAVADFRSEDHKKWSARLHAVLVEPLGALTERLVIVPHGVLHYLPFAALDGNGKYLVDRHTIRILPSASVLLYLPNQAPRALQKALVLGNPDVGDAKLDLPFAEDEARAILATSSKELRVRDRAGEAFVKKHARDYDILHFAAHGVFDARQPLASALLLARGDGDDGLLTVGELFGVAMPARLVTLSACDTALGDVKGADEVVGFTRALLFAGARTIVASLWKVDDRATRDLMVAFYAGVLASDRETALRRAQQTTRDTHPHPYFWAGFQAYGDHL